MNGASMFQALSDVARNTRSNYHLTLGELIQILESAPQDAEVWIDEDGSDETNLFPGPLDSHAGYYYDLAFEPTFARRTVADVLADAKVALGLDFGASTPLWVGDAHLAVVGCEFDGMDDYRILCRHVKG